MSDITPKEFFEGEWYKDATKKLCAEGWPMFVVPLNIQVRNLLEENQKLKEALKVAVEALELAVKSGEFFSRHADCRKDSWSCRCEFCKDNSASKNLRESRQALEKVKSE